MNRKFLFSISSLFSIFFIACSTIDDNSAERLGDTYIPDDQFEQWLIDLGYDDKLDDYVLTENAKKVTRLCNDKYSINDFTGLEDFTSLESLCVYWGEFSSINLNKNINLKTLLLQGDVPLTNIDLSKNTKLEGLNLYANSFANIDLSNNTELISINLSANNLTEFNPKIFKDLEQLYLNDNNLNQIDISDNLSLEKLTLRENLIETIEINHLNKLNRLDVDYNKLQSLDVSENLNLSHLNTSGNPLECITVNESQLYNNDNNTTSNDWKWYKDDSAQYSLNCENVDETDSSTDNLTYVPNDSLEGWLIGQGYDDVMDDYVKTDAIKDIRQVIIDNCQVDELTGIEDFQNLEILKICSENLNNADFSNNIKLYTLHISAPLETINLTNNLELNELYLNYGNFSEINLKNNAQLEYLNLDQNEIEDIDLSKQTYLKELSIFKNNLTSLDLSNNPQLISVFATENLLKDINIQNLENLENLSCYMNELSELNLTDNIGIKNLNCNDNNLTGLDVSSTILATLRVYDNPLNCIKVNENQLSSLTLYAEEGVELSLECE